MSRRRNDGLFSWSKHLTQGRAPLTNSRQTIRHRPKATHFTRTKQRPFLRGQAVERISRRKGSRPGGRAGTEKSQRGQAVARSFPTALRA